MFTGIIEMIGTVVGRGAGELVIAPRRSLRKLSLGESVSVDGVCLTVDRRAGQKILFRLLEETVRSSTLGALRKGDPVNLERSLRCGDRLGGHLLLGHVDGQGVLVSRSRSGRNLTLGIELIGYDALETDFHFLRIIRLACCRGGFLCHLESPYL